MTLGSTLDTRELEDLRRAVERIERSVDRLREEIKTGREERSWWIMYVVNCTLAIALPLTVLFLAK